MKIRPEESRKCLRKREMGCLNAKLFAVVYETAVKIPVIFFQITFLILFKPFPKNVIPQRGAPETIMITTTISDYTARLKTRSLSVLSFDSLKTVPTLFTRHKTRKKCHLPFAVVLPATKEQITFIDAKTL